MKKLIRNIHKIIYPSRYKKNGNIKPLLNLERGDFLYAVYVPILDELNRSERKKALSTIELTKCEIVGVDKLHVNNKLINVTYQMEFDRDYPELIGRFDIEHIIGGDKVRVKMALNLEPRCKAKSFKYGKWGGEAFFATDKRIIKSHLNSVARAVKNYYNENMTQIDLDEMDTTVYEHVSFWSRFLPKPKLPNFHYLRNFKQQYNQLLYKLTTL